MNQYPLDGTWKGEVVLPGRFIRTAEDKVTEFYFKIKMGSMSRVFSGIFFADPELSDITEHAVIVGEINGNNEIEFEIRYSKFYFYSSPERKEVLTINDKILTTVKFTGKLSEKGMLYGWWKAGPTIFEYEGEAYKTLAEDGTWWAKKLNKK